MLPDAPYFVYRLFDRGEVVYVGFSTNPVRRLKDHSHSDKSFDSIAWAPQPDKVTALKVETETILALRPRYNQRFNTEAGNCSHCGRHFLRLARHFDACDPARVVEIAAERAAFEIEYARWKRDLDEKRGIFAEAEA